MRSTGTIQAKKDTEKILMEMVQTSPPRLSAELLARPKQLNEVKKAPSGLPTTVDELDHQVTRSYDLTVTAAADLNIPIALNVGGGYNRRVVVLEHTAYKRLHDQEGEQQWGYALRLCMTVNKWNADMKISLPFLAASAEVGVINAQWMLQVVGLAGPKIDDAQVPPAELNVETFVIAKQSLEKMFSAVRDAGTKFSPSLLVHIRPTDAIESELIQAVVKAYALTSIERGRSLDESRLRLGSDDRVLNDVLSSVFDHFGVQNSEKPASQMREKARSIIGRIRADLS